MKNQNTSFLRFGYFLWFILVFALIGCQQAKLSLTYQSLLDEPVQSRTQPASLSQKSAETLIQEGFIKIGSLNGNILKKTCRHYFVGGKIFKMIVRPILMQTPFHSSWRRVVRWEAIW